MKATTVKVYKNARGNDLRNAHKSIDCCHHFCRLWVYRNKIFAFHTSSSAYYFTRSPSNVECSRWNKMKKLIITKVDETDRPFLYVLSPQSRPRVRNGKTKHTSLICEKNPFVRKCWPEVMIIIFAIDSHSLVELTVSVKKKEWRKTGVKTSEARENKQKNLFMHRWWQTL